MPSLTPISEATETLTGIRSLGFFPGTSLYSAPFPYPGSTSYPGAEGENFALTTLSEGALTLSTLLES